ncbi:MAG: nucleotide pyrophosphohydrolase [Candidatus Vecturithrix sp.]|jgi:NTP pyrophosphatase (non-canonical NTP hydrolase)|nr:nucleotide pyrophosphohydrolase [Candidatus Vecturithrix sp.]
MEINDLARDVHNNAVDHGWWESSRPIPELLCLVHSEVSEALEAYRNDDLNMFREEVADIIIRCLDMSCALNIDIESEILRKHGINKSRPYRHGGKKC